MRNLVVAVSLALSASSALAADFGIGVSVKSEDGAIYVPVQFAEKFRLEPSVRYGSSEDTSKYSSATVTTDSRTWELGLGAFGLTKVSEAARIYYGARVSYFDGKTTSRTVTRTGSGGYETTLDGFGFAPTLGVEFVFANHFSLGGEAAYVFQETDSETVGISSPTNSESEDQGTQTRLIFRYMF
jgi:opacity protein-like surface antigen